MIDPSTSHLPGSADRDPPPAGVYGSDLFERFVEGVARMSAEVPVLDLGPTVSENLMFWVRRSRPVTAIDAVARHREDKPLGIADRKYAGVLCWNVLSALPRSRAEDLARELSDTLLPGGYLFAIFDGDGRRSPPPLRYRIAGKARLRYEPGSRAGELRAIPANEIESLFGTLKPMQMMVMRHGSREALGQSPAPASSPFPDAPGVTGG